MAKRTKTERKQEKKRKKEEAEGKPTRRISDTLLMRALDPHMQESLSEIAAVYQRLMGSLGLKTPNFYTDRPRVGTSITFRETALETAHIIANWQKQCIRRKLRSQLVLLLISDGDNITTLMRKFKLKRECVKLQLRACLSVWSLARKRINFAELNNHLIAKRACC